jgi:hypothetical protein
MNSERGAKTFRKLGRADCESFCARRAKPEDYFVVWFFSLGWFLLNARRGRHRASIAAESLTKNEDYFVTRLSFGRRISV